MRPAAAHRTPTRAGRLAGLVVVALSLIGCGGGGTTDEKIAKIVGTLAASAAFTDRKRKAATSFRHFLEQRVTFLTKKNAGWLDESGSSSLAARIGAEADQLAAFITTTLAGLSPDTKAPAHRDLDDAAHRKVSDGASTISNLATRYKARREERVRQIVWRAGAVQDGVWSGGDSTLAPTLVSAPLLEIVDRRLRGVEIMMLHDGRRVDDWTIGAVSSDWKDDQRASMFEYPWVDETDHQGTPIFANALTSQGLTIAGLEPTWHDQPEEKRVYFGPSLTRLRADAAGDWVATDEPYVITYTGAGPVSAALERLMPPAPTMDAAFEDFWQRNWMYCDMMIALLHVEAFRFARKRRTTSDTDFDNAAAAGVTLRPIIPRTTAPDAAGLMASGADWFEGVLIPHDEIQIGDHLILWNSAFVRNMLGSAFGLENSIVTRIMKNGHTLMLAGHGEPEFAEAHFLDELASEIRGAFKKLRKRVKEAFDAQPDITNIHFTRLNIPFHLVRWAPFGETFEAADFANDVDGAWWVRIRRAQLRDQDEADPSMAEALARVPKAIRFQSGMQAPPLDTDHTGDFQESIYLPLSVPKGKPGGWAKYLADPQAGETVELSDLRPDGTMVPGLNSDGPNSKIPIFRPKLKAT